MRGGRPFRFLALMLCGWGAARGIALYRDGGVAALPMVGPVTRLVAAIGAGPASARPLPLSQPLPRRAAHPADAGVAAPGHPSPDMAAPAPDPTARAAGTADVGAHRAPAGTGPAETAVDPPRLAAAAVPPAIARGRSRLAGSAWVIARGGMIASVTGGQLGGSQAGARVTYALDSARTVAVSARLSAPLAGRGREAAVGIDWQPTRAPVHVIAERRVSIDGGRGGTVIGAIGGFGPSPVTKGITLEGYGQAGIIARGIARGNIEGFGDGALRAAHLLAVNGRVRVDIGAGAWGGAQRGASRLDIGPSLGLVVPVGARSLRLTADWRQRVAGSARPGSGPALSIGTDF